MRPHPVVEQMMNGEVGRRVAEVMDLVDQHGSACNMGEFDHRQEEDVLRLRERIEAKVRLLVMGMMVAEMEVATK